jgi:integrase
MREGIRLPDGNVAALTNTRQEKSRERVLTDDELKAIWRACPDSDFGAIVKLLILTSQRRTEIGSLRWNEVDLERATISLPVERTKNKRAHVVPLSPPVLEILKAKQQSRGATLFGITDKGFTDWSKSKAALDTRITGLTGWRLHDLRRTTVTGMAGLGIQPHIIEAVINHVSGHKGGVAGIYNRAAYDKEKRAALDLWAEHVMALVESRKGVVVPMKA